ncbi:ceramidase domain-containing protein [Consotaella aegiceratis]|uniref:ceramidase domain-containing protein n=1 Tax=Consotaella aegiceratis TaxID=3097961 RepID=UPI002F407040
MDWTAPVDAYCERLGPEFWAEPLNAASNAAFLVAAGLGLFLWWGGGRRDRLTLGFIVLVAMIGVGSFLFHTVAQAWAGLADVLPIAVFVHAYFALALARFWRCGVGMTVLGTVLFAVASIPAAALLRPLFGSSASYIPALAAMLGVGMLLVAKGRGPGRTILAAGCVFALSLALRLADDPLCQRWPWGTHFGWHILNATTLGLLLVAAIRDAPRRGEPSRTTQGSGGQLA